MNDGGLAPVLERLGAMEARITERVDELGRTLSQHHTRLTVLETAEKEDIPKRLRALEIGYARAVGVAIGISTVLTIAINFGFHFLGK